MIKLPDFSKTFEYENDFYLSSGIPRIGKLLVHYELFKKTQHILEIFGQDYYSIIEFNETGDFMDI